MFLRTSLMIIFLLMAFVQVNSFELQQQLQLSSSALQNFSLPSELLNCSDSGQTTAAAQNLLKSCHHRYIMEGLKSLENSQPSKDSNFSLTEKCCRLDDYRWCIEAVLGKRCPAMAKQQKRLLTDDLLLRTSRGLLNVNSHHCLNRVNIRNCADPTVFFALSVLLISLVAAFFGGFFACFISWWIRVVLAG
ncbi:hypothetical protein TYRP_019418 [Tyrophagus putrescentiae]|nr:hypothetical protein TYRP_019418 [Tyrophagus putrescentiae]